MEYKVYVLRNKDSSARRKTYIGKTPDLERRLKEHHSKSRGARATRGGRWRRAYYFAGFPDEKSALQFEWALKHVWKHDVTPVEDTEIVRDVQAALAVEECPYLRRVLRSSLYVLRRDRFTKKAAPTNFDALRFIMEPIE